MILPDMQFHLIEITGTAHRPFHLAQIVVTQAGFIAGSADGGYADIGTEAVENFSYRRSSAVAAVISAQTKTDDKRTSVAAGQESQIGDPKHNIRALVGLGIVGDHVIVPQILFGRLQFHNPKTAHGGCPHKIRRHSRTASGDAGQKGSVSVGIYGRNRGQRVILSKGMVQILVRILSPEKERKEKGTVAAEFKSSVFCSLIPQPEDPGGSVRIAEQRVLVIDTRIDKADDDAFPVGAQSGLAEGLQDPRGRHAGSVHKAEQRRKRFVGMVGDAKRHGFFQRDVVDHIGLVDIADTVGFEEGGQFFRGRRTVAVDKFGIVLTGYIGSAGAHNTAPEKCFLYYMRKMNENLLDGRR